ncbi:hypothetical protein Hamer_G008786 [Homarus americanus]|uniref:Uncharacterized protein n=1 Tax=Homarus americanus TaxID=6706 RepID=A0A8J5JH70_HOMAM|nr:hypothetical protein Hamer_G008786 [Homarus americanus]
MKEQRRRGTYHREHSCRGTYHREHSCRGNLSQRISWSGERITITVVGEPITENTVVGGTYHREHRGRGNLSQRTPWLGEPITENTAVGEPITENTVVREPITENTVVPITENTVVDHGNLSHRENTVVGGTYHREHSCRGNLSQRTQLSGEPITENTVVGGAYHREHRGRGNLSQRTQLSGEPITENTVPSRATASLIITSVFAYRFQTLMSEQNMSRSMDLYCLAARRSGKQLSRAEYIRLNLTELTNDKETWVGNIREHIIASGKMMWTQNIKTRTRDTISIWRKDYHLRQRPSKAIFMMTYAKLLYVALKTYTAFIKDLWEGSYRSTDKTVYYTGREFVETPSMKMLKDSVLRKDDWMRLADTYEIEYQHSQRKSEIQNAVLTELVNEEVLPKGALSLRSFDPREAVETRKLQMEHELTLKEREERERERERQYGLALTQVCHSDSRPEKIGEFDSYQQVETVFW